MQEKVNLDLGKAKKGILTVGLIGALTVGVIIALTFNANTLIALKKMDTTFLWLAMLAVFISWFFSALAFYVLARAVKKPISMVESSRVYLGGSFFGFITPFGSGLIPTQIYILSNQGFSPGQATAITSTRVTISSWLFVALGLTIFIAFRESLPPGSMSVSLLLGIVIVAAAWSLITLFFIKKPDSAKTVMMRVLSSRIISGRVNENRLRKIKDKVYTEIDYLSSNLKDLFSKDNALAIIVVFLIEVIAWFAFFAVLPLVLFGFGVKGSIEQLIFRLFLLFSLAPASPTPGGSGVIELASTGLLYGIVPGHIIGLTVLVWRALTYYLMLLAGGAIILRLLTKSALPGAVKLSSKEL